MFTVACVFFLFLHSKYLNFWLIFCVNNNSFKKVYTSFHKQAALCNLILHVWFLNPTLFSLHATLSFLFFAKLNSPSCFLQRPTCRPATKGTSWFRPQRGPQLANGGNGEGTWTALRGVHRHVWQRSDLPQGRSNLDWPDIQLVRDFAQLVFPIRLTYLFRDNTYGLDRNIPIPQATILTVNSSGHIINSWGQGQFFLPHMITVDKQNNVWVTDVALHQVIIR